MIARSRSGAAFGLAIATLIAFKLWLVHGEEIVGSATQYDALWYLRSARDWYWGATYDWIAFIRPCAYPLWIASVRLLHIPLRLAIELLQIGGALILVFALRSLGLGRGFCVVSFACLCLHPICFQLNDYTMSDTLYCALLWFTLGGLLLVWSRATGGLPSPPASWSPFSGTRAKKAFSSSSSWRSGAAFFCSKTGGAACH